MSSSPSLTNLISFLVVAAIIVFRTTRQRRMSIAGLWIAPSILVVLSAFVIWGTSIASPGSAWATALACVVGIAAGIPFGIARGHHSDVRLGEQPNTIVLHPSVIVMVVWLLAFGVRYGIRVVLPSAGSSTLAISDGCLIFAVATVAVSNVMIFQKYRELRALATPSVIE